MRKIFLVFTILQLVVPELRSQDWIVPDDKKGKLSTFPFDDNIRKAGEKLYTVNCQSCHGTPGKSNFIILVPPPGDPATEKIQKNNDGEIFYKITTGRGQMPSFRSVLTSNEIWNIISYVRSYNKDYKQQLMAVITSTAYPGAEIKMSLFHNNSDSTIVLRAEAEKENSSVPVSGAEVRLLVNRTFGMLQVDEVKTTDKNGIAVFRLPDYLPGDTAGNIPVSARFIDEEIFGTASKDTIIQAGTKFFPVSLVAERAMWNKGRKAPVWIILSYGIGLLAAWGFIFYVLMKLRDIYIVGKAVTTDKTR
jgi:mono/diheme cytochrome c family protein